MKQELEALEIMRLEAVDIIKLIDFMPADAEDVRKLFVTKETSLSQDEIDKIVETIKNHKK